MQQIVMYEGYKSLGALGCKRTKNGLVSCGIPAKKSTTGRKAKPRGSSTMAKTAQQRKFGAAAKKCKGRSAAGFRSCMRAALKGRATPKRRKARRSHRR